MAGQTTDIGGISVSIQANTAQLDAAIAAADAKISNLGTGRVMITAEADLGSAKRAATQLQKEVQGLQRASKLDPIAVRFKFDSSRGAVRQTRDNVSKELARQGGIQVDLTPTKGAKQMLIDALGPVVVPVAFVWNGEWANGVPTVNVNTNLQGGGGGTTGGTGGTPVQPKQPPTKPTGGAEATKGADQKSTAAPKSNVKATAKQPVASAPQAEPIAAEPIVAAPAPAKTAMRSCTQCGEQYDPTNNGWNRHQSSQRHRDALRKRMQGETASEAAPRVTNLPYNPARGEEIMASTQTDRGIYPQGGAISAARAGVAEQRNLGQTIDLGKIAPGGEKNPLLQRYVAAGGDLEALRRGQIRAVKGREADFEEEFPGPGGQQFWNKERTAGFDPRSMRVSAGDYAAASPTQPGQFTAGAATEGGIDRETMGLIFEEATRLRAEAYRGSDEFKKMTAARRKVFRTSPVTGELEQTGTEFAYGGEMGERIDQLRALREQFDDPTLTEEERGVIGSLIVGQGFNLGAQQRVLMDKRAYAKSLEKRPGEEPRIGKGARRFRKLAGGQGRKGPRAPTNVEDIAVIEVRDIVLDVLEQLQDTEENRASQASTGQAMATRGVNEATGRSQGKPRQFKATGAPGFKPPAAPVPETRTQLKSIDDAIKLHRERIATLNEEIRHVKDDDETIEGYRADIARIEEEELKPLLGMRAEFIAGLGERKPKAATVDPLTSKARQARDLETSAARVENVTYEPADLDDFFAKRAAERRAARSAPQEPVIAAEPKKTKTPIKAKTKAVKATPPIEPEPAPAPTLDEEMRGPEAASPTPYQRLQRRSLERFGKGDTWKLGLKLENARLFIDREEPKPEMALNALKEGPGSPVEPSKRLSAALQRIRAHIKKGRIPEAVAALRDIETDIAETNEKIFAIQRTWHNPAGPNIPQFAGSYNPEAPIGAAVPGETLSQRIARMEAERGGAGSIDRGLTSAATPVEEPWMPAWRKRETAKDLTRYASGGGPEGLGDEQKIFCKTCNRRISRSQFNSHQEGAAHKRNLASKKTAASSAADVEPTVEPTIAAAPETEAVAAEPIRTRGGTKAEAAAAASGTTKFCTTCGRNVKAAGHENTAMHKNNRDRKTRMAEAPGTARVAGGIDIATGEPVPDGSGRMPRAKRDPSGAGLKGAVDISAAEDISNTVRKDIERFTDFSTEAKQFASQVVQENPVRALSVAVGQVLVNTIGGRARLIKLQKQVDKEAAELNQAAARYGKALERQNLAEERVAEIRAGAPERMEGEADRLEEQLGTPEAPGRLRRVTEGRRIQAETQKGEVENLRNQIQGQRVRRGAATLAVGTVGIVAGTALFQAAMAAFNLAVEQAGIGLGRMVGSMSAFEQKTGELTSSLAEAARANYGNVEGTVAGQMAMAGFGKETAESIRPLIEMRTRVVAGTKAFEEQLDMIRASRNIATGVRGGMDVRALTETTGGFPFMNIGGQRSVRELMSGELGATAAILGRENEPRSLMPSGSTAIGRPTFTPRTASAEEMASATTKLNQNIKWWNEQAERGGSQFQLAAGDATEIAAQTTMLKNAPWEGASELAERLAANGQVLKGANSDRDYLEFLQGITTGSTLPEESLLIEQQTRQLRAQMQGRGAVGRLQRETVMPAQQYLSQIARPLIPFNETVAARTPGADQASNYQSTKTAIDAAQTSLRAYADQGERAANEIIRQADAVTGSNLTGQWQQATSAVAAYGKQISSLQVGMMWKQVNLQVAQYDEQLRVANRSLADAKEFLTGIDSAGNDNLGLLERQSLMYSRQSAQIGFQQQSLGIQSQLLGMQNQKLGIRSKELSLQSAQLGRQSQELGFQSQAMQLAQNQRQINFQVAMAGFSAPGTTPEERAARIEEAKVEADFAQKQQNIAMQQFGIAKEQFGLEGQQLGIQYQTLDLDKQQFALQQQQVALAQQAYGIAVSAYNVQQQIVELNAARAVEDLSHQIDLLTQARQVTISVALDQEALQNLEAAQAAEMEKAQSILDEAVDIRQQIISSQVQIAGLLGQGISTYASSILRALGVSFAQIDTYMSGRLSAYANLTSGRTSSGGSYFQSPGTTSGPQQYRAEGYMGMVNSPTHMVVGEAGGEQVAILSNPRHMTLGPGSMGGGGGGNYVQINVTGNSVRSDDDLEMLATLVARKVEETLGRRASQLGFRVTR